MQKKISIAVTVLLSIVFISCSKNSINEGASYTDEEILSSVTFVGQETDPTTFNGKQLLKGIPGDNDGIIIIKITLGRKKKKCRGFGICKVILGPIVIYDNPNPHSIELPYTKEVLEGDIFNLYLANESNIEMKDVDLPIDEDILIYLDDKLITTMVAGNYKFSPEIGEYGGYSIKLQH